MCVSPVFRGKVGPRGGVPGGENGGRSEIVSVRSSGSANLVFGAGGGVGGGFFAKYSLDGGIRVLLWLEPDLAVIERVVLLAGAEALGVNGAKANSDIPKPKSPKAVSVGLSAFFRSW